MKTWVRDDNGRIGSVMVCERKPEGTDIWIEYPAVCDIGSPLPVAGRLLSDFTEDGMLKNDL